MKLNQLISFWGRQQPETPAIVMFDMVITYRALGAAIHAVAGHLSNKLVDTTGPVGILVDHPARNVVVNCALMLLGIPSIVIREQQLGHLPRIGARTLVYEGNPRPTAGLSYIRAELPWFGDKNPPKPKAIIANDRTKLAFTSGTTGIPKAISFADADIAARSNYLRAAVGNLEWTRSLIMPGLSTNFAFSQVALALEYGRTISFAMTSEDTSRAIDLFAIDLLIASNQQAQVLVDYLASEKRKLRHLKCVWLGGAVPTASLLAKINEYLCRDVMCVYASTEAHVAAFGYWNDIKQVERSVGYVCPWASVEAVDENGATLGPGRIGEIRIRTPNQGLEFGDGVAPGDELETWFYPGDQGMVTADGMLVIQGRAGDTINKGGVKLSATVLDDCLATVPGVGDIAVCGVQIGTDVEQIVALVVAAQPVDATRLNRALAQAKIEATIDRTLAVEAIPRNQTGKVNREELRALARRKLGT